MFNKVKALVRNQNPKGKLQMSFLCMFISIKVIVLDPHNHGIQGSDVDDWHGVEEYVRNFEVSIAWKGKWNKMSWVMFASQPHMVVVRLCVVLNIHVYGSKRDFQDQMTSPTSHPYSTLMLLRPSENMMTCSIWTTSSGSYIVAVCQMY